MASPPIDDDNNNGTGTVSEVNSGYLISLLR